MSSPSMPTRTITCGRRAALQNNYPCSVARVHAVSVPIDIIMYLGLTFGRHRNLTGRVLGGVKSCTLFLGSGSFCL